MTIKITNAAAMGALAVLRGINKESDKIQQSVSSELRIASPADNASYWSFAAVMRSDSTNLQTIGDAMGVGSARVDSTYTAMSSAIDLLTQIRAKLVSATENGIDKDKVNTEISSYKEQLQTVVQSTSFAGENWLLNADPAAPPKWNIIGGFVRSPTGEYQAQTIDINSSSTIMIDMHNASGGLLTKTVDANTIHNDGTSTARNYYLLNAGSAVGATGTEIKIDNTTTAAQLKDMTDVVDNLLSTLNTNAASLGITQSRIDDQISYTADLSDAIDKSVGALVDTDMDEASTLQKAITTQQQMGVESISLLNTAASKILILLQ